MTKASIVKKLESIVACLREQVAKNDGSTLSAIAAGAKFGLHSVSAFIKNNETAQKAIAKAQKQLTALEKAVREGDQKVSAKALDFLEKTIQELKDTKTGDAKTGPTKKTAAKSTAKSGTKSAAAKKTASAKTTAKTGSTQRGSSGKSAAKGTANTPAAKKTAGKGGSKNTGATTRKTL